MNQRLAAEVDWKNVEIQGFKVSKGFKTQRLAAEVNWKNVERIQG